MPCPANTRHCHSTAELMALALARTEPVMSQQGVCPLSTDCPLQCFQYDAWQVFCSGCRTENWQQRCCRCCRISSTPPDCIQRSLPVIGKHICVGVLLHREHRSMCLISLLQASTDTAAPLLLLSGPWSCTVLVHACDLVMGETPVEADKS